MQAGAGWQAALRRLSQEENDSVVQQQPGAVHFETEDIDEGGWLPR